MDKIKNIQDSLRSLSMDEARRVSEWLADYLEKGCDEGVDREIATGDVERLAWRALSGSRKDGGPAK